MPKHKVIFCFIALVLLTSCNRGPEPLNFGTDECSHCRMTIMDEKYGAEIVTGKGKVYKYDAMECLINGAVEIGLDKDGSNTIYVIDTSQPGKLIPALGAYYLISEELHSPMGAGLSAFESETSAREYRNKYGGEIYNFEQVKEIILKK